MTIDTSAEAVAKVLDGVTDKTVAVKKCGCGRPFCNDYRLEVGGKLDGYMPKRDAEFFVAALQLVPALSRDLEAMRAELHLMKTAGIVEVAIRNPSVAEYMFHWEARAEQAEAERDAAIARAEQAEADADSWKTRADLSQAAIAAKNAQILDLIEALRGRTDGEICGCGVDNPTDVCLSHYDVIEAVVRNRVQAAIATAMMGAVKPLEWSNALGYSYTACAGQYFYEWFSESKPTDKQLIVSGCKYDNHGTLEKDTVVLGYYPTLDAAKAAAQADYQSRMLSHLSIPTDATAALEAVKAQARDDTVRSAAIAAGNAIVAIAADADPDISPLRKQMLRVKMEKAVKVAAFTRDA